MGQVYCLKNKLVKARMEWKLTDRRKECIGRHGRKKNIVRKGVSGKSK